MTGRGFVFQLQQPALFLQRLGEMPQEQERYPLEIHCADDPDWSYYQRMAPSVAA